MGARNERAREQKAFQIVTEAGPSPEKVLCSVHARPSTKGRSNYSRPIRPRHPSPPWVSRLKRAAHTANYDRRPWLALSPPQHPEVSVSRGRCKCDTWNSLKTRVQCMSHQEVVSVQVLGCLTLRDKLLPSRAVGAQPRVGDEQNRKRVLRSQARC